MARNEYAHMRLTFWALWCARMRGSGNFASAGITERVDGQGWDAPTVISNIDAEAEETDRAVSHAEPTLREALQVYYVGAGGVAKKARKLGVSEATLYARVEQGTHAVARWLDDQRRAADAERQRVEALQRAAAASRQGSSPPG